MCVYRGGLLIIVPRAHACVLAWRARVKCDGLPLMEFGLEILTCCTFILS